MTFLIIALIMALFHPAPKIPWEKVTIAPPVEIVIPSNPDEITIGNIIVATNKDRVFPVIENEYLDQLAQWKADDMAEHNYWKHEDSGGKMIWERVDETQYNYKSLGENLGEDFKSVEKMENMLMLSKTHKENIQNPNYKDIGVGISGRYVVILFGAV